jgi:hypothetical protein
MHEAHFIPTLRSLQISGTTALRRAASHDAAPAQPLGLPSPSPDDAFVDLSSSVRDRLP